MSRTLREERAMRTYGIREFRMGDWVRILSDPDQADWEIVALGAKWLQIEQVVRGESVIARRRWANPDIIIGGRLISGQFFG